jgi:tetratricopeptide (TPR) repeat protein
LKEQLEKGLAKDASPSVVVLLGMAGQGKSQLAMEYCRAGRSSNRLQAIFWIDASSNDSIQRGFEAIFAKITGDAQIFKSLSSAIASVKSSMERWEVPWLLIFDSYNSPDETINISTCLPQTKYGSVIITSRHSSSKRLGSTINIGAMLESEALRLLFDRSELPETEDNRRQANKIAEQLGNHALAVDQAGSYISSHCLSMTAFLNEFRQRKDHILRYTPSFSENGKQLEGSGTDTSINVFATMELSLQGLPNRKAAEEFLTLSAFFNCSKIGEDLFKLGVELGAQTWTTLFLTDQEWDHYKYRDAVLQLKRIAVIQSVTSDDTIYFSLHPLVADWLRLRKDKAFCKEKVLQSCSIVKKFIDKTKVGALELEDRQYWLAHVSSCFENEEQFLEVAEFENKMVLGHLFSYGFYLRSSGHFKEAERVSLRALAAKEKYFGVDHTSTLDTINNLGLLYHDQGKMEEAEKIYLRGLKGYEKAGPDQIPALNTALNLGNLYRDQGKLAPAEQMLLRSLNGYKMLAPNSPVTFSVFNSLGLLYKDQGKMAQSGSMLLQALAGMEKTLGSEHTTTLGTVNNIGVLHKEQGRLTEAEQMLLRGLRGYERTVGPNNKSTLSIVNNLGLVYHRQGKLVEADQMLTRALKGYEEAVGPDHIATLNAVMNLGNLYKDQGKMIDAEKLLRQALVSKQKTLGFDHPSTFDSMNNLGLLLQSQGRFAEAEGTLLQALAGREKTSGPDHPSTLNVVNSLGVLYFRQRRIAEAERMYTRALAGKEKTFGPNDPSTLVAAKHLAVLLSSQGRMFEAEQLYRRVREGSTGTPAPIAESTAAITSSLANLQMQTGQNYRAQQLSNQILQQNQIIMNRGLQPYYNTQYYNPQLVVPNGIARGQLPYGWEKRVTTEGKIFYIDHITKTTQWNPPS